MKSAFANIATATALSLTLNACVSTGDTIYTPREAGQKAASQTKKWGNLGCSFIYDRALKRQCLQFVRNQANENKVNASAEAATIGSCKQSNNTNRNAQRDNINGNTTYDRTSQNRSERCNNRAPNSRQPTNKPIF